MSGESDIEVLRRALDLTEADEAIVHEAAPRLLGEIDGWVAAFYERLSRDEAAMALLRDEAIVLRVRHALTAWFQELLSLPYDAVYERTRAEIGRAHVRFGMPQHLMVTAMSGIRRDVRTAVMRIFASDLDHALRLMDSLVKVFDLELALMLDAYRRHSRELAQRTDRALYARRAESRAARARADAADAAACYLALLRRSRDPIAAERWSERLADSVEAVAHMPALTAGEEPAFAQGPRRTAIGELCTHAIEQVSVPARTDVDLVVDPPDARVVVHELPLRLALEELTQNAVNRDPGGSVRLAVTALADGGLLVEISDGGPRWPESVRSVDEAVSVTGGIPAAFSELLVELHGGTLELVRPPGGGGAIRVRLRPVPEEAVVS